jgi:hypothetical protein
VEILYLHWSWYRMTHCQVKYTGCDTVWHIASLYWSWYRITYGQVKGTGRGIRYNNQSVSPGNVLCGTTTNAFHVAMCHAVSRPVQPSNVSCVPQTVYFTWQCAMRNARWKALVMVPYDTLPGERHWSWYHMPHGQGRGTGRGTVWQRLTHDHVGSENKTHGNVSYGKTTNAT